MEVFKDDSTIYGRDGILMTVWPILRLFYVFWGTLVLSDRSCMQGEYVLALCASKLYPIKKYVLAFMSVLSFEKNTIS